MKTVRAGASNWKHYLLSFGSEKLLGDDRRIVNYETFNYVGTTRNYFMMKITKIEK